MSDSEGQIRETRPNDDTETRAVPVLGAIPKLREHLDVWVSLAATIGFFIAALLLFPPPLTEPAYFSFCVLFILYAGGAVARAVRAELILAESVAGTLSPEDSPVLRTPWRLYSDGFRTSRVGHPQTCVPADSFFSTDGILAEASRPWFPVLGILKSVPGTFTGLGILGTFVGFAVGLSHFDSESAATIQTSINVLIGGINIGFHYSIIGIAMSIVFNLVFLQPFLRRMDHQAQDLCDGLDSRYFQTEAEYTIEHLSVIREGERIAPGEALRMLVEDNAQQSVTIARFSADVADAIGATVKDSMEPVFVQLTETLDRLIDIQRTQSQQTSGEIVDALRALMEGLGDKVTGGAQKQIEALIDTLVNAAAAMRDVPVMLKATQGGINESVATATATLGRIPETMVEMQERITELINENIRQQKWAIEQIRTTMSLVESGFVSLQTSIQKAGGTMATFDPTLDKMKGLADKIYTVTQGLAETQSGHLQSIEALQDAIAAQLGGLKLEGDSLKAMSENLQQQASAVAASAQGFEGLDSQIASTFTTMQRQIREYNDIVEKNLSKVLVEFSNHAGSFGNRLQGAITSVKELVEELTEAVNIMRQK